ncbi:MAG: PEP-CTERM sorting domain-containing protein [Planctomycetes bacterium]|nr:PEP-CTERM sorting domain-containing protein [Planctomycetota bacterium]
MRILRFAVLAGVLFVQSGRASAALILVHDNGGPNLPDGLVSDPTFPAQVGDDFQISQAFGITRVTWYGAYKGGDQLPDGTDHFSLRFFPFSNPTNPSPTSLADLTLSNVLRLPTSLTMFAGNPVFAYEATFPVVNLIAGHYLLSIVNDTTGMSEQWMWHTHGTAPGSQFWKRSNSANNWLGPFGTEMSFQIYAVPEPATVAMMGVAGLVLLRRRGRR